MKRVCLRLIRLYQKYISPGLPRRCRFSPTCSQYAFEAIEKYGAPVIVIDFGTATTIDAISAKGVYLGGTIGTGLRVTMDALTARAAMLPRVELAMPRSPCARFIR